MSKKKVKIVPKAIAIAAQKKFLAGGGRMETVEEYLARGGKITKIETILGEGQRDTITAKSNTKNYVDASSRVWDAERTV